MKEVTEKDRTYFINILREKLEQKEQQVQNYSNKIFELGERLILLNWIVHNINAALEIIPLSKFVCTEIKKIIESDFCAILIYNYETQTFDIIKKEQSHTNKIFNKIFKEDLQKYNLFLKKFIQKRPQNIRERIEAYIKEFDANKYVYPIVTADGFIAIIYSYKLSPIREKCDISMLDIICDNYKLSIENIKLYKQLEESNRHKTEFIANVTHEFKTPLNAIIGFAELLKNTHINTEKANHFINNIVTNSHHLLKLIEDILDISRMELNSVDLVYETCNSKQLIEETAYILEGISLAKNLEIKLNLIDTDIIVDKRRYKQVIYNLLNNAIKFSFENGQIVIFTYIENNNFYFEITDNGIGIPLEATDKIFDMFSQGCKDILKKEKGHGIGLFICKRIVNLHKGEIFYYPTEPCGTTFKFYVPYVS